MNWLMRLEAELICGFARLATGLSVKGVCLMGFGGGLCMSAIKRDRGIKDFGASIAGHGGFLDRMDSLCFAAPVFFHLVRYFYAAPGSM